ncbi:MAG: cobyrinate a,c-diamide synthase [Deltaproteobacteria bacterium]|uniref:cobyrinate a,c-diamide synthase n=1 Tax=Hydrosulfovibrio ferrireducens TaxID=2934181 RepID=UPI00121CAA7C|nr:MAG: cobyrinate a,c-diamide synthase [Deltaproteobacteria bacterium]
MQETLKKTGSGIVLAAPSSDSGKTLVSLGLGAALVRDGLSVQYFKCGPDFIDPTLHRLVSGRGSRNLDLRMCGPAFVRQSFSQHCAADFVIVEGVMGLFDGGEASTASLARTLALPVVLVVDASSCAESIAALVHGFESFDPQLTFAGVIFNRVGSESHYRLLAQAVHEHCRAEVLGGVPRHDDFLVSGRHLGLHMDHDEPLSSERINRIADVMAQHVDLALLREKGAVLPEIRGPAGVRKTVPCVRLGIARDAAFCFYYEDNLDLLRAAGAELIPFSPLADSKLPDDLDGLYLGGGYPELHAEALAANRSLREEIGRRAKAGLPIYGECGGFMYLCEALVTAEGTEYPMAGVFPVKARMQKRLVRLGYRTATVTKNTLWPEGASLFGHEFHYSETDPMPDWVERMYRLDDGRPEGFCLNNTLAGYMHLHLGSTPEATSHLIEFCRTHGREAQ